ncbi:MAG: hypothetical protein QOJ51_4468, partial [Acidobacteriaceae bacterium]|nr:hypothetical protein [Acidobacteriaceae bacterium]
MHILKVTLYALKSQLNLHYLRMHLRDPATRCKSSGRGAFALSLIFRSPLNLNASPGDSLIARPASLKIGYLFLLIFSVCYPLQAQTYEVGPSAAQQPSSAAKPSSKATSKVQPRAQAPAQNESLGWGSNIQDARIARAAEMALKQGNHPLAVSLAQRAAQSAPNDPQIWILLGYAARLNHQYGLSVDAYSHGLRLKPGAPDGMSGLAQTYAVMGRTEDAMNLLKQVIAADPRRIDDSLLLGELTMKSGDYTGALGYFRRAEQMKPDTRSEVLMALSYQRLKQFDLANRYL